MLTPQVHSSTASGRPDGLHWALVFTLVFTASATEAFVGEPAAAPEGLRLAYLDPGTGSLIIQVIAASLAAGAIVARTNWQKIKGFFGAGESAETSDGDLQAAASPPSRPRDD